MPSLLQALEFVAQVRDSPDAWHVALTLLISQPLRYVLHPFSIVDVLVVHRLFVILHCKCSTLPLSMGTFSCMVYCPLTSRFYQDVAALEQTKAVLMSFLDPEPANNPAVYRLAEPQCNLLVPGRCFVDNFYRPTKPDRAFPCSVISSYIYLVVDDFLR